MLFTVLSTRQDNVMPTPSKRCDTPMSQLAGVLALHFVVHMSCITAIIVAMHLHCLLDWAVAGPYERDSSRAVQALEG